MILIKYLLTKIFVEYVFAKSKEGRKILFITRYFIILYYILLNLYFYTK